MDPHAPQPRPSKGTLLADAKVVAGAAKATLRHEPAGVDKGKVAGAAANLLDAASHYGKLEGKSAGKYTEKAEGYLRTYQSSHSAPAGHVPAPHHESAAGGGTHGQYLKMAQGLLGAHSGGGATGNGGHSGGGAGGDGGHSGGGGYGNYVKMAEGLLKKH